jgi:RNA polymerase sigma factor (sigma-70 family)
MTDDVPPAGLPASAVAAARRRRSSAWIQDHLDAVYRYAHRLLAASPCAREDAEDVTQQAFLSLVAAEAEGRQPEDAGAWLLGVARRRAMDLRRRHARGHVTTRLPHGWDAYAREALPSEALERREVADLVAVALGLLPPADRALLEARYRDGRTVQELAALASAETTEKAVENRLRRARRRFEERFLAVGRDWAGEGDR